MNVPSGDPFGELRIKERIINQDRSFGKFARKAQLMMLGIVLLVTLAGIILLYTLAH
jgi:hypothetical protein